METFNGMSGKQLRDWRKANRRQFSEQIMLQSVIVQLKSLDEDDKQKLLDLTEKCFSKRKNRT